MAMLFSVGCIEIPEAPESGENPQAKGGNGPGNTIQPREERGNNDGTGLRPTEHSPEVDTPVELPESCETHCNCPAGYDCINLRCVLGDMHIYCCTHSDCPSAKECWYGDGTQGFCPESSD